MDDEQLYRSVRGTVEDGEYFYNEAGKLIIRETTFRDRNKKPSVDRAKLRGFDPSLSKLSVTDGIVSLVTAKVRAIGEVRTGTDVVHSVDVVYKPIYKAPKNLAHSQITVTPEFFGSNNKRKNVFKLLRIALARLATENGWTLQPENN